jgi:hypothetical protein
VTPFEHLAVFVSIVLGLSVTQLLASVHRLAVARARVRFYWLPLLWVALIFVTQVEWWWAIYAMRQRTAWNFVYFLFVVLSPVSLYLAAAFALPDVEPNTCVDLRESYYANRGWFFGAVAVGPVLDAARRATQAGTWRDAGVVSNLVSAVMVATLAVSRRPAYHAAVTLSVAALFLAFIAQSAFELR